ncbi:hypothetical protein GGX14DRAFT_647634 [Mycena pura]|uniref:BTB domain-containing protein n=1 Tax=Mycena pura TaxID=153505 RepID=A0AAD6V6C8_9AGAR|nr:hypothetical protein GGX14DRAFT_647634 [Mycena pura]
MSDQSTPFIRDAPAPFSGEPDPDNHRAPDFILRFSDGVDFHVHKDFLKLTSDFFDGMFSIPKANGPDDLSRDGLTVLTMAEPNKVLYRLLSLAYPAQSVAGYTAAEADLDVVLALHEAAKKYGFFRVLKLLKEMLPNISFAEAHSHRLFAIARLQELPVLVRKAALHTLKLDVAPSAVKFPEMKLLTWDAVQNLFDFHHACGVAAQSIILRTMSSVEGGPTYRSSHYRGREHEKPLFLVYNWGTQRLFVWWDLKAKHGEECGPARMAGLYQPATLTPAHWFLSHMQSLSYQLRLQPSHESVKQRVLGVAGFNRESIDACPACSEKADRDLATFASQLAVCIEESNMKLADSSCPSGAVSHIRVIPLIAVTVGDL